MTSVEALISDSIELAHALKTRAMLTSAIRLDAAANAHRFGLAVDWVPLSWIGDDRPWHTNVRKIHDLEAAVKAAAPNLRATTLIALERDHVHIETYRSTCLGEPGCGRLISFSTYGTSEAHPGAGAILTWISDIAREHDYDV